MSNDSRDDDYEVGYGKPPKLTRFKKGKSGNPKGRPKGARGLLANLKHELESKITIQEGGRSVRISKAEVMAKRLTASALKGDTKTLMALVKLDPELFGALNAEPEAQAATSVQQPDTVDYDILRDFLSSPMAGQGDRPPDGETIVDWEVDGRQVDGEEQDDDGT